MHFHSSQQYIVENKEKIAKIAKISPHYIVTSAKDYCTALDLEWVIDFLQQSHMDEQFFFLGKKGVLYTEENIVDKFSALCGLFIRYFLDARLFGPYDLVAILKLETRPHIVFLHALEYIQFEIKSDLVQFLFNPTFPTVVNIQDKVLFRKIYGDHIYQHMLNNYMLM